MRPIRRPASRGAERRAACSRTYGAKNHARNRRGCGRRGVVAEIAPKSRSDRKIDRLGTESTFKLLLEFSIPAVAGMLVQMLYNVIDAVYVGHAVGADGLATTTVANPMMTAMVAVAMLVGVGGNALAAIKLGERKKGVAERDGQQLRAAADRHGGAVGIAIFALEPILRYSGADGSVLPLALDFMTVIVAGCPLQFIAFGMNNFIRTAGHPNRALGSMLVGTGANVVLGYPVHHRARRRHARRRAGHRVLMGALSALFVMQFFLKKAHPCLAPSVAVARPAHRAARLRPRNRSVRHATGLRRVVYDREQPVGAVRGAADALGVDGALAVMRVLSAVGLFTFMPAMGIAMGAQPIVGYNYGARAYGRMKLVLVQAIVLGIAITTPLWATVVLAPDLYAHLFGLPEIYMKETAWALVLYLMFIPILPIQTIGSNYFDATGQAAKATVLTLTRQILFLIPLLVSCPLVLPQVLPITALESVWLAPSISDITSTLIVSGFLAFEWRRLRAAEAGEGSNGLHRA